MMQYEREAWAYGRDVACAIVVDSSKQANIDFQFAWSHEVEYPPGATIKEKADMKIHHHLQKRVCLV